MLGEQLAYLGKLLQMGCPDAGHQQDVVDVPGEQQGIDDLRERRGVDDHVVGLEHRLSHQLPGRRLSEQFAARRPLVRGEQQPDVRVQRGARHQR